MDLLSVKARTRRYYSDQRSTLLPPVRCVSQHVLCYAVIAVLSAMASAQVLTKNSVGRAELVEVKKSNPTRFELKVRLKNPWTDSVFVQICDSPPRPAGLFSHLEQSDGRGGWMLARPHREGTVYGDLPGGPFELKPGAEGDFCIRR